MLFSVQARGYRRRASSSRSNGRRSACQRIGCPDSCVLRAWHASLKPLLKWPGGKRFLANDLTNIFRRLDIRRYFEPFAGGAAVFFAFRPSSAILSDTNAELVNLYSVVRDQPEDLIESLRRYRNNREEYYRVRDSRPKTPHTRAARLYYLMRLSFNGIYRENRQGDFNVPYGQKTHLSVSDLELIRSASAALQRAKVILCQDFRLSVQKAKEGDLIYCDPPYTVRHNNNGFVKYNRNLFGWKDQVELATVARSLAQRGCYVVISNADHHDLWTLYSDFNHLIIRRPSVISAKADGRGPTTERLIFSRNIAIPD